MRGLSYDGLCSGVNGQTSHSIHAQHGACTRFLVAARDVGAGGKRGLVDAGHEARAAGAHAQACTYSVAVGGANPLVRSKHVRQQVPDMGVKLMQESG